jgi:predicted dehydrogenase
MDNINVGFFGAGDISLLHAEAIKELEGATLKGIWNRTRAHAETRAAAFGCSVYDSPEALLADPEIDAVFILTNMETHRDYAIQAIRAGKHVLVEKPTASSLDEIRDIQEEADRAGVKVMPVHNYIYEPGVMRTRELIDSGKLGDLVSIYMLYNIHHPEAVCARYPGVIRQILTHHAYTVLYLAGEPDKVSCMKATINDGSVPQENIAMATMQMKNKALAHICASFASDDHAGDPWTCMIKVIGSKGATRFSYRDWVENTPAVVHSQTYSCYPYSIKNTAQHFLDKVVRRGEEPLSTVADAYTCQRIIEACEQSEAEGRHISL